MLRVHYTVPEIRATTQQNNVHVVQTVKISTNVTATIAKGKHPDPFRTRKLSLSAPMVLQPRGCGRVGRRRTTTTRRGHPTRVASTLFPGSSPHACSVSCVPGGPFAVHRTTLSSRCPQGLGRRHWIVGAADQPEGRRWSDDQDSRRLAWERRRGGRGRQHGVPARTALGGSRGAHPAQWGFGVAVPGCGAPRWSGSKPADRGRARVCGVGREGPPLGRRLERRATRWRCAAPCGDASSRPVVGRRPASR